MPSDTNNNSNNIEATKQADKEDEDNTTRSRNSLADFDEGPQDCRAKLEATMDNPTSFISTFVMITILFAIMCFMLESVPAFSGADCKERNDQGEFPSDKEYKQCQWMTTFWAWSESCCVVVFTVELLLKWFVAKFKPKFCLDPMIFVDILAVFPWYLDLIFGDVGLQLSWLRAVRLLRVIRAIKLGNSSAGVKVFVVALRKSTPQLMSMLFFMLVACIIFASIAWEVEKSDPDCMFLNIPHAIWWCIVTMTTVGYGDTYPVTPLGKLVAIFAMLSGILIFALPITVIGSNYESAYRLEVMTRLIGDWKIDLKKKRQLEYSYQDVLTTAKSGPSWGKDHAILMGFIDNMWPNKDGSHFRNLTHGELLDFLDEVFVAVENATDFETPDDNQKMADSITDAQQRIGTIEAELTAQREMLERLLDKVK